MAKPKRFKLQRRLGVELPGLGKPGAMERRPYPPGQHGQRRKKVSEYGIRLLEKQKLRFNYQMGERPMKRFVHNAKRQSTTNWVGTLAGLLERRLDNILFRLGFASSILAARQMCSHGHVFVNDKKVTIGSAVIEPGSKIHLADKIYQTPQFMELAEAPRMQVPDFLERSKEGNKEVGMVNAVPGAEAVPFPFEPQLIAEYYAKEK